ncbi:PhnG protein [Klebsiella pneumoniae IS43]|uniref:PhnG protein n=1 Tax=Klebsiella pneumoniae IS43 TaxID=1432552 RepID=W1DRT3_KLEPN|nr:PhnG protein [Klebsiella pneumoniae IS43]
MHFDTATRQRWMSVLAHSEPQDLLARMQSLQLAPEYELIRTPETAGTAPGPHGRYRRPLLCRRRHPYPRSGTPG